MASARTHSPATAGSLVSLLNRVPGPVAGAFRSDGLLARLARPVLRRLLPAGPTVVVVRSGPGQGLRFPIYPRTEKFYWTGAYERPVQDALARLLEPGMTFWDVGAHIGWISLLAARLVGEGGRVHAFEPLAENRARLAEAIELNSAGNVAVHAVAVAGESGEGLLRAHASTSMWSLGSGGEGVPTPCRTLDELAAELGPPDVLKLDVEGVEVEALRGGRELLAGRHPVLLVEFSSDELLAQARALLSRYRFEQLARHHWLLR